jgi:hypothetical protein
MAKILEDGETWIGSLFDDDDETPIVQATLERRGDNVVLKVPFDLTEETHRYGRWFMPGMQFADDPDRTKFRYSVPDELRFLGKDGYVHLIGCRNSRMTSNGIVGVGEVKAAFVVFDSVQSNHTFATPQGIRSSVSNLREWLGVSSLSTSRERNEDGLVSANYKLEAAPPIVIPGVRGMSFVPHWRVTQGKDSRTLHDELYVETILDDTSTWSDHIGSHRGIRDLLVVSQWRQESVTDLEASQAPSDKSDRAWRNVLTDRVDTERPVAQKFRRDLITFGDIGVDGIAKWYDLRDNFSRAIDPIVSSKFLEGVTAETLMSQVGIGLEALGYLIAQRDHGKSENAADKLNYVKRFKLIGDVVDPVVPFDTDPWTTEAADAYNAVKHANRTLPDLPDLANAWRKSLLVFRAWVAIELGVELGSLEKRIKQDPMSQPYV